MSVVCACVSSQVTNPMKPMICGDSVSSHLSYVFFLFFSKLFLTSIFSTRHLLKTTIMYKFWSYNVSHKWGVYVNNKNTWSHLQAYLIVLSFILAHQSQHRSFLADIPLIFCSWSSSPGFLSSHTYFIVIVSEDYLMPRQPSVVFCCWFFFFMLLFTRVKKNLYVSHAGEKKKKENQTIRWSLSF